MTFLSHLTKTLMALDLAWYDFVCFGIVAGAIVGSLSVIFRKEGGRSVDHDRTGYESLVIVAGGSGPSLMPLSLTGHVGSAQMWMSCWRGVHPGWLLGLRMVAVVVMVGILSWDIWLYGSSIMLYYTEWTFMLVIFYFMIGTAISAHGCWLYSRQQALAIASEEANKFIRRGVTKNGHKSLTVELNRYSTDTIRQHSHHEQEVNEKRAGNLGYLMQIVYQTTAGAVMLTDVVFWCLLVPFLSIEHFSLTKIMCCMHSLNVVFLLLETSLNSLPFPWFRMAYFVLWSCLYVIFQWILHACGLTWWPYPFLELSIPWAPAWYIGMALVHIPCYGFYWLIVKAKNSYFPKVFPETYLMSY